MTLSWTSGDDTGKKKKVQGDDRNSVEFGLARGQTPLHGALGMAWPLCDNLHHIKLSFFSDLCSPFSYNTTAVNAGP